ncbi:unnamed protein product [Meloidogyne enterolobii]|uniref:Uncharacterized protein n=1 Tax=Meloidogyne enterolobii TaxID=390850 RepID=A0ACB0ZFS7_MELEN
MKACPRCGALITKMNDGSCNHMQCALCNAEFCWLCLKQINELHYLRFFFKLNTILLGLIMITSLEVGKFDHVVG